jgi:hypothetical protein
MWPDRKKRERVRRLRTLDNRRSSLFIGVHVLWYRKGSGSLVLVSSFLGFCFMLLLLPLIKQFFNYFIFFLFLIFPCDRLGSAQQQLVINGNRASLKRTTAGKWNVFSNKQAKQEKHI